MNALSCMWCDICYINRKMSFSLIIQCLISFMNVCVSETCKRPRAVHEGVWPSQPAGKRLLRSCYLGVIHHEGEQGSNCLWFSSIQPSNPSISLRQKLWGVISCYISHFLDQTWMDLTKEIRRQAIGEPNFTHKYIPLCYFIL